MNLKKILGSIFATIVVSQAVVAPVLAADTSISGIASEYSAYRLMNLSTVLKTSDCHNTKDDEEHTTECYRYAYKLNKTYKDALKAAIPSASETDMSVIPDSLVLMYLESLLSDSDDIRAFADKVYMSIKDMEPDYKTTSGNFGDVEQGYYLFAESKLAPDPDSRALVKLDTVGQDDVAVETKESIPFLEVQIEELNDTTGVSEWLDRADYDIGDNVSFRLTGSVPDNIEAYKSYQYIFWDTLSPAFDFDIDTVNVYMNDVLVDESEYSVIDSANDCTFKVVFPDLVETAYDMGKILNGKTRIIVEFDAILTENAELDSFGNDNVASLEFSNDPYNIHSTSKTLDESASVLTYRLTVNVTDKKQEPLEGAGFKLLKHNGVDYMEYKKIEGGTGISSFSFNGLDAGKYKLVETYPPVCYKSANDFQFEVVSVFSYESDNSESSSLSNSSMIYNKEKNEITVVNSLSFLALLVNYLKSHGLYLCGVIILLFIMKYTITIQKSFPYASGRIVRF